MCREELLVGIERDFVPETQDLSQPLTADPDQGDPQAGHPPQQDVLTEIAGPGGIDLLPRRMPDSPLTRSPEDERQQHKRNGQSDPAPRNRPDPAQAQQGSRNIVGDSQATLTISGRNQGIELRI